MKYYIVAGEASGDLHGSNLMKEINNEDNNADFRFLGGDLMNSVGGHLVKHYKEMAFMGLIDVIMNLRTILKNMDVCKQDILNYQPDVVILIDYPGFNMRIAEFAKKSGFKVFYYISPKIWAWRKRRVHRIKKCVDEMFSILPFEIDFYNAYQYKIHYVGNPCVDAVRAYMNPPEKIDDFKTKNQLSNKPIIALLSGSRKAEIKGLLPHMLETASKFIDYQFVIAGAPATDIEIYKKLIANQDVKIVYNQTYELLQNSVAAIVASGTATLETALIGTPQVVCYKTQMITYMIAKPLVDIKFFSLPNLIMDTEIVKELMQFKLTERITNELTKILKDPIYYKRMKDNYELLRQKLGLHSPSKIAAQKMVQILKKNE